MKELVWQMVSTLLKVNPKMRMINGWTRCSKKKVVRLSFWLITRSVSSWDPACYLAKTVTGVEMAFVTGAASL